MIEEERWKKLEELFHTALPLEEGERSTFLYGVCTKDPILQRKIESLISLHEESKDFLESPQFGASELLDQLCRLEPANPSGLVGKTISHYRVVEWTGAGGMGVVYKAEDIRLRRFVALKFLPATRDSSGQSDPSTCPGYDAQTLERFQREARAASALDHPNICTVYEVDEWEGSPFIAMQFLSGRTLKQEIDGKALPTDRIIDLGIQIADALDAAHGAGIIHRDIKPTNIFVTQRGEAKILDFGLAKLSAQEPGGTTTLRGVCVPGATIPLDYSITNQGEALGTVAYMSPEQVRGEEVDARTDIFSCGVVLYEMSTGRSPFQGETPQAIFDSILHQTPTTVSGLNSDVPEQLRRIIRKAMAVGRSARYQTAADLRNNLRSLKRASESGTVLAEKLSTSKHWRLAALLTTLLIASAGATLYFHRPRAVPFAERDSIVLADFANSTGELIFDEALKQALRAKLEQSPYLNVVSDLKTSEQLRYMGRAPDARLNRDVAREVCVRMGNKAVLGGAISRLGDHYIVGLDAMNCQSGDTLASEQEEAESRDKVLRALDAAATRLRMKLGESLASVRKFDAPAEQATTTSLEALQAYSLAVRMRSPQGEEAAVPFFKRATELDPNFAMAYAKLGTAYSNLNLPEQADVALKKAYQLRDRVSQLEKLYIETHYYDIVTGQYEKAVEAYQLWQQIYPNDLTPYGNLAKIYDLLGQHEKNLGELLQVVRLDPNLSNAYSNLANAYVCLNRIPEAKNILAQAEARHLETPMFWEVRYEIAFLSGDPTQIERQFETAMSEGENGALAFQADTEAYYGHLNKAREFTQRAVEASRRDHDAESAIGDEVVGALHEADFGNTSQARKQIAKVLAEHPDAVSRALGALVLARVGATGTALDIARDLHQQFPYDTLINGYWIPTILATVQLHTNPSKAVEILDATMPYELGLPQTPTNAVPYPIYIRGLAFLAAGEANRAAGEFQKILDNPGVVGNYPLGALAHLGLARAYALEAGIPRVGHPKKQPEGRGSASVETLTKASNAYQEFFVLWKDADPDIPILKHARAEFDELSLSPVLQQTTRRSAAR